MAAVIVAPETLKLKPSPTKWIMLSVTFAALAVGMGALYVYSEAPKDNESLWVVGSLVLFFVAGSILSLLNLQPDRSYLLLAPDGFTFRAPLANPLPDGILEPQGSSAGLATWVGRAPSFIFPSRSIG